MTPEQIKTEIELAQREIHQHHRDIVRCQDTIQRLKQEYLRVIPCMDCIHFKPADDRLPDCGGWCERVTAKRKSRPTFVARGEKGFCQPEAKFFQAKS